MSDIKYLKKNEFKIMGGPNVHFYFSLGGQTSYIWGANGLGPMALGANGLYRVCGSRKYRRFGRRATSVKNCNAGPKLHWRLWPYGGKAVFRPFRVIGAIYQKLIPLFDFFGPKLNFFSLTVCRSEQYLKNGSEKLILVP